MKVLYLINAGIMGGRERHVLTLVRSLPPEVEHVVCSVSGGEATDAMRTAGLNVEVMGGANGHDWKIVTRFVRLMRKFRPDVVHVHAMPILPGVVLKWLFPQIPVVETLHGPADGGGRSSFGTRFLWRLCRTPDYYLGVSRATWESFRSVHPEAKGEVVMNALHLPSLPVKSAKGPSGKIIGMVGRMADVKDWPSFQRMVASVLAQRADVEAWAIGDGPLRDKLKSEWQELAKRLHIDANRLKWLGSRQDARELIGQMDAFLLTSKDEQLPTTLLEAFAMRTPVAGFLPVGGTSEVLDLAAEGKLCALLRKERDCEAVAENVIKILSDDSLRNSLVQEGYRIVSQYFDFQKICQEQLIPLYQKLLSK